VVLITNSSGIVTRQAEGFEEVTRLNPTTNIAPLGRLLIAFDGAMLNSARELVGV
jgi:hypothetical protein